MQHEAAQRGELDEDAKQPVIAAPWVQRESSITVTQVILGSNVMVFIAMVLASGPSLDFTGKVMVHFGANFGPFTLSGDWWRLLTYMFLHGGLMHIAINMWCLWDLGTLCEHLYGRWTFGAIYLITGIAGGVASVGWNPQVLSVGASGAVFGLAGCADRLVLSRRIFPPKSRDWRDTPEPSHLRRIQCHIWHTCLRVSITLATRAVWLAD